MRKYLYTTLLLALLAQEGVMAQENEGKKGGFFGKIKDTFSTEIKIGNYTFKDGSVYTGEMKGRKPNGKGKTVFKNGDVFVRRTVVPGSAAWKRYLLFYE